MSLHRSPSALVKAHAKGAPVVRLVTREDVARIEREQDPFGIAHACCSPGGHQPIDVGGVITCFHCAVVFWP